MGPTINSVIIVGAGGNVGSFILPELLKTDLKVSVLTRPDSTSKFDSHVNVVKSTYEPAELKKAFTGQDAVVSLLGSLNIATQRDIVIAAADAGIKYFIPSEFGGDTTQPKHVEMVPFFQDKVDIVELLKTKESTGMSWTAVINGAFFDFCMKVSFYSIDVKEKTATIYGSGDGTWDTTILPTVAIAVANLLSKPEIREKSLNRYVAIRSFKTSQNEIVKTLEKITGEKYAVTSVDAEKASTEARARAAKHDMSMMKELLTIPFMVYGLGDFEKSPGLDNDLVLPGHHDDLEETLRGILKTMGQ